MRYIVAIAAAFAVVFALHLATGFGSLPRPWGALIGGSVGGVIAVAILAFWERNWPSEDHAVRDARIAAEEEAREARREERRRERDAKRSDRDSDADGR